MYFDNEMKEITKFLPFHLFCNIPSLPSHPGHSTLFLRNVEYSRVDQDYILPSWP